ncbi:hypothetical protein EOM09_07950 [bacterium]|nr:hypothetical protein [bacterium]
MKLNTIAKDMTEIIFSDNSKLFYSYNTPVVFISAENKAYKTNKRYSSTTTRHISKYLEGKMAELKEQNFFNSIK